MIIVDTRGLFAAVTSQDRSHDAAADLLRRTSGEGLVAPGPVITETLLLIRGRSGRDKASRLWSMVADGAFDVEPVDEADIGRALEIERTYADADLGYVDACLLAICERLRCARVFTFDRKLALFKPSFAPALELLP